jgi:hypothetical protein
LQAGPEEFALQIPIALTYDHGAQQAVRLFGIAVLPLCAAALKEGHI